MLLQMTLLHSFPLPFFSHKALCELMSVWFPQENESARREVHSHTFLNVIFRNHRSPLPHYKNVKLDYRS